MRSIPSRDIERQRFAEGYHDLIHDDNRSEAVRSVGDWLDRQLKMPQSSVARTNAMPPGRPQDL
jgi:hypothetical protein